LILRFSYVENSLRFNLADFPVNFIQQSVSCFCWYYCSHITNNTAHHIMEVFYADKLMVMGNSKNLHVFNFTILPKSWRSWKFDTREIYVFSSSLV